MSKKKIIALAMSAVMAVGMIEAAEVQIIQAQTRHKQKAQKR